MARGRYGAEVPNSFPTQTLDCPTKTSPAALFFTTFQRKQFEMPAL